MSDDVTAAPRPLKFADGSEYLMSPLNDRDIEELDQWVRSRFIDAARQSIPADATDELHDRILSLAMREALTISWMSAEGARMMATVYGMARLALQSIRKNHPEVTQEELTKKLFEPRNLEFLRRTFHELNVPKKGRSDRSSRVRRDGRSRQRPRSIVS